MPDSPRCSHQLFSLSERRNSNGGNPDAEQKQGFMKHYKWGAQHYTLTITGCAVKITGKNPVILTTSGKFVVLCLFPCLLKWSLFPSRPNEW